MHRRSTLSSPVASVLIGILLPPVSRITPLVFSLLTLMLDIDRVSLVSAQASIDRNGLSERIALLRVDLTGPIRLPLMQNTAASIFDFSVCNSPFYACTEEATRTAAAMELLPSAVCTGTDVEMITRGGEEDFVSKMVGESITHGQRC
ncbi:hypothetical protein DFH94DRAFT_179150 [Russula ochroleuca]|uniref:Uncharacterized protein n=1 Tax=Russula ochroleuca TaxID=152965 RepID=A0A9P5N577_9AGAM|nr:hypothetical protein DFH94DRAFT_179150 [Russula ochroleuca]